MNRRSQPVRSHRPFEFYTQGVSRLTSSLDHSLDEQFISHSSTSVSAGSSSGSSYGSPVLSMENSPIGKTNPTTPLTSRHHPYDMSVRRQNVDLIRIDHSTEVEELDNNATSSMAQVLHLLEEQQLLRMELKKNQEFLKVKNR